MDTCKTPVCCKVCMNCLRLSIGTNSSDILKAECNLYNTSVRLRKSQCFYNGTRWIPSMREQDRLYTMLCPEKERENHILQEQEELRNAMSQPTGIYPVVDEEDEEDRMPKAEDFYKERLNTVMGCINQCLKDGICEVPTKWVRESVMLHELLKDMKNW